MRGISVFYYSVIQGIKSLRKNSMFTIASIGTIAACLFLFGLFYFMVGNFQSMIHSVESSVGVTVFFQEGIAQPQIDSIGKSIKSRPEVSRVEYISAQAAWDQFKEDMKNSSKEDLVSTFGKDNPLANSASYEVYVSDISKQAGLVKYIEGIKGVRQVNRSDATANSLANINTLLSYVSGTIVVILLAVSIFLIRTTISNGITIRRTEISIMRLMGASDFFIKAPFIVEGVIMGFVGALIPLLLLFLAYGRILDYITSKFTSLANILTFLPTGEVFAVLIPVSLLVGVGIGFLGSFVTVHKHLRV